MVYARRHSVPGVISEGKTAQLLVLYELPRLVIDRFDFTLLQKTEMLDFCLHV